MSTKDGSLEAHSQLISLVPGKFGSYLRVAFYRMTIEHCDPTATIGFGVMLSKCKTRIGKHVYIGPRCILGWVSLDDDVLLGPNVQIPSGQKIHTFDRLDIPVRNQPSQPTMVSIGSDVWVGAGSVVMADIGAQAIVGANSTVTRTILPQQIAVGSPAQSIGKRGESNDPKRSSTTQRPPGIMTAATVPGSAPMRSS